MLEKDNKTININNFSLSIEERKVNETKEFIAQKILVATEEVLHKIEYRNRVNSYLENNQQLKSDTLEQSFSLSRVSNKISSESSSSSSLSNTSKLSSSNNTISSNNSDLDNSLNLFYPKQVSSLSEGLSDKSSINRFTIEKELNEYIGKSTLSADKTNLNRVELSLLENVKSFNKNRHSYIIEVIKKKIQTLDYLIDQRPYNDDLAARKKYWVELLEELKVHNGELDEIYNQQKHERFKTFYFDYLTSHPLADNLKSIYWEGINEKMISVIQNNLLKKSKADPYWEFLIQRLRNINEDVLQLFLDHEELFFILQEALKTDDLPQSINIYTKAKVYPKLFTGNIYANIGRREVYGKLRKLELTKDEGKFQLLRELDEVIVSAVGEKERNDDGSYPALLDSQWYKKHRINGATNPNSTFWKASVLNTKNNKAYLYTTIAQRHAYYKFADAYLKSKGIVSEWFDAAAKVTIYSPLTLQVAVGAADRGTLSARIYLSAETAEFLRGGNKFLLEHNMKNVQALVDGKGIIDMSFIDANGKEKTFKGLTKKELDFKLVEYEQSLVEEYINNYIKENTGKLTLGKILAFDKIGPLIDDYLEQFEISPVIVPYAIDYVDPRLRLERIIKEINEGFNNKWLNFTGENTTELIIEEFFTKKGKSFDFGNYKHRVVLGQKMVEELYYRRYRDEFNKENFSKILANNKKYLKVLKPKEQVVLIYDKKLVPPKRKTLVGFYLELYKDYERLKLIFKDDKNARRVLRKIGGILNDLAKAVEKEVEEYILNKIGEYNELLEELVTSSDNFDGIIKDPLETLITDPKRFIEEYFLPDPVIIPKRKISEYRYKKKEQKDFWKTTRDNLASKSLINTAKRIFPEVDVIKETKKVEIFTTNYKKAAAILLYEFATGEGKNERNFNLGEHDFANKILTREVQEEILSKTLELLERIEYDFINMPDSIVLQVNLGFSPSPGIFIESLYKHLNSNFAQIFIGGAIVRIQIKNGYITGYIYNETTRTSLMLHMNVENEGRKDNLQQQNKLSTVIQRIYFSFKLPQKHNEK
ncbi:conserved hypothetical protein [Tenacibaculum sp. 190524A05c]|uniref:hypothetical protein n=1 Tax=Tenacibaculum platacis TaxID=3137852 RepID=UPI0031FB3FBA